MLISLPHCPTRDSRPSRAPVRRLGWLVVAVLPLTTQAVSPVLQDFAAALHCTPDVVRGNALFTRCAACHRADGSGSPDGAIPAIAAQNFRVVARALVNYRHHERWDPRMVPRSMPVPVHPAMARMHKGLIKAASRGLPDSTSNTCCDRCTTPWRKGGRRSLLGIPGSLNTSIEPTT